MILTKDIKLTQEQINYIQRLDVEMCAHRSLISFMISSGMDISNERFKEYQKEYEQSYLLFETAKSVIEEKYVDTNLAPNQRKMNWNLNYKTCMLTIIYTEDDENNEG